MPPPPPVPATRRAVVIPAWGVAALLMLLVSLASVVSPAGVAGQPEPGQVDAQLAELGAELERLMADELADIVAKVKGARQTEQAGRLQQAGHELGAQTRHLVQEAAAENRGETTRMSWADTRAGAASLVGRVQGKLDTAGDFLSSRLATLANFASGLGGSAPSLPARLRRLVRWPSFAGFKLRFNKVYRSLGEALYRQMVYLRTQASVGLQNVRFFLGQRSYLLAATFYADWTPAEYRQMIHNGQLETGPDAQVATWSAAHRQQLERLASAGRTLFGEAGAAQGRQVAAGGRRRKREAAQFHYSETDELDDDEDEDDDDEHADYLHDATGHHLHHRQDADHDELSADEIAAAIDLQASHELDQLHELLDDALQSLEAPLEPVDLRKTGCFGKPENQMACGACYAYTTVAAASYYNCMQTEGERRPKRLNARFVSDCGRYLFPEGESLIRGCAGGRVSRAVEFASRAGLYEFIPYEVRRAGPNYHSDTCAMPRPSARLDELEAPVQVPTLRAATWTYLRTKDEMDLHLRTVGPVFVNMRVFDGFQDYQGGIVDDATGDGAAELPIHSMLLVGHALDQVGRDYWIIRNSHGLAWGEAGYLRISDKRFQELLSYAAGLTLDPSQL